MKELTEGPHRGRRAGEPVKQQTRRSAAIEDERFRAGLTCESRIRSLMGGGLPAARIAEQLRHDEHREDPREPTMPASSTTQIHWKAL